jgi:iron complex outermembrane recepter protein
MATFRTVIMVCAVVVTVLLPQAGTAAQSAAAVSGRLLDSVTGLPIAGATVQIDELRRQTTSSDDGTFRFEGVPPGSYHLSVRFTGYSSRRTEVAVSAGTGAAIDVTVDPELHFQEVVSVGPDARSQFEAFQPTSVLSGQELTKALEPSLGETLESQPGIAVRSLGSAPARPVVRGLDGDRVLILQDGQRTGDISSQSGDHGVAINPAAARSIEVVRGPATLLYGANAIGGLVNVITDDIPTRPVEGASGNVTFDVASSAKEAAAAGAMRVGNGRFALTAGGASQRTSDFGTPEGEVANSQSRNGAANVGVSWTGQRGYLGGSYGYDDSRYGVPVVDGGVLELTPRRHSFSLRGGARGLNGAFDEFRATFTVRRYEHDELEGDEVGTSFHNDTNELEVMGSHRAVGRLKGSAGGWFLDRAFDARGAEALSPAVDQRGVAAFAYEEVAWPHATIQFGGRLDHVRYAPAGEPERTFTTPSGSVGLLLRPAAAHDKLTIAASLAHAERSPALEELFFFGLHHGNFAIELGNPNLRPERALGVDLSLRWRTPRVSGEITYFRNDISDFIYRNPLDAEEFEAREDEFLARFPGRELVGHDHEGGEAEDLAIIDFVGADAVLQGVEFHTDVQVVPGLFAEGMIDYVRGTLSATGDPLPRMPPMRVLGGLRYQYSAFQVGGQVAGAARQARVSSAETPTGGYGMLKLYASYSFQSGPAVSTITARIDNATDALYRNHLSLIKDLVPEMGRNFKLLYNVTF